MADAVRKGALVRIALRGRRVGGWVIDDDVEAQASFDDLRPLSKFSSDGPPPELVDLATWAAWRWAGPTAALLRAASPPKIVRPGTRGRLAPTRRGADRPVADAAIEEVASGALGRPCTLVSWPPALRMAELLRRLVAPEGSTVMVIPDVERGVALAEHLRRAGFRTVEFHGHGTAAARTTAWVEAREGACVIVGGRVAVWAPVPDLAAVVLVDEGDEALKNERTPTWHARDVGAERARRVGARLVMVTPVPTLEALAMAPGPVATARATRSEGWGLTVAVDRRDDAPGTGMFSAALVDAMRGAFESGPVVCVLNRKGRARLLACDRCRLLARCDRCSGPMAEDEAGLVCRVCLEARPRVCAECGSMVLARLAPGVRRLREELAALLPRVEVVEVDASTGEIPEAGALIGTEAVLHRVPSAALVAFLDFDQELLAPRFRAAEQALWLLVRAIRLTARHHGGRVRSQVVVQTRMPDHEVIRAVIDGDSAVLLAAERARREALKLPPFGALAEVEGEPHAVTALADGLTARDGAEFLGPVDGPGTKVRALVRAQEVAALCDALAAAAPAARARGRLRIDVDPLRA